MGKLTPEYKVDLFTTKIAALEDNIESLKARISSKKQKIKVYLKKLKNVQKEVEAAAPKVVNIKRGRKKVVA
jgi:restriction endonuclease S subunit